MQLPYLTFHLPYNNIQELLRPENQQLSHISFLPSLSRHTRTEVSLQHLVIPFGSGNRLFLIPLLSGKRGVGG